jgi:hypothetical protein
MSAPFCSRCGLTFSTAAMGINGPYCTCPVPQTMTTNTTQPSTPDPIQAAATKLVSEFIGCYNDKDVAIAERQMRELVAREQAENEKLRTKVKNQADRIRVLEGPINHAGGLNDSKMKAENARLRKLSAELEYALALIAAEGGRSVDTEFGRIKCDGFWCSEQAKSALRGKLPEIDSVMQREDGK